MDSQLYYFSLLSVFAVIAYMVAVDDNVGKFIILLLKMARINITRGIFWLKFYPRLRFDTALLKWKSREIIKKKLRDSED